MLPAIALTAIIAFLLGWTLKDYRWTKASKNGKVVVVDGNMYKVKPYVEKVDE